MILSYQQIFENLEIPNVGDLVVCIDNIGDLESMNHIGILKKGGIQFLNRFNNKLHDLNGELKNNKGWNLNDINNVKPFDDNNHGKNIPLIYSNKFKDIISYDLNFLLDYEKLFFCDVSFIDVSDRSDTISCLLSMDYDKLNGENPWISTRRQNIRISGFLRKIIGDNHLEKYVNEYKYSYKIDKNEFGRLQIADGLEIAKWYLEGFYTENNRGGNLHQSCMRYFKSQKRLPIYTGNPDKVRLLYLTDASGKLTGRALIWKLDEPKRIFMDRIYYSNELIEKLFLDYAKSKDFLTYNDVKSDNNLPILLRVNLNRDYGPPQTNPFMDTFKFFVKNGNYLTNKFHNFKAGEYWEYVDHD